jgi:hypothetical protein
VFAVVLGLMAGEGSPVLDVVEAVEADDPTEEVRPKELSRSSSSDGSSNSGHESFTTSLSRSSSSDGSSNSGHESFTTSRVEESAAIDPDEASRSYIFDPSAVTVSCIHVMASLCYFAEGDAWAPWEEVISEPADDEAVVFEEFYATGLRMPPQPTLTDILFKF